VNGWEKQEQRLAKTMDGRRRAGSGAFWSAKGDVRSARYLVEAKWTGAKQITVKSQVLEKIVTEAVIEGRIPVLALELNARNYVVLTEDDFLEMRDRHA
jgi:Holliday junction resolvase